MSKERIKAGFSVQSFVRLESGFVPRSLTTWDDRATAASGAAWDG